MEWSGVEWSGVENWSFEQRIGRKEWVQFRLL